MVSLLSAFRDTAFFSGFPKALPITVLLMLLCASLYLAFGFRLRSHLSSGSATVEINDGVRSYTLSLLCDSGSFAKDPFSGKPVLIVRADILDKRLVAALSGAFTEEKESDPVYAYIKPRVIPMKTVSGTCLLYAFLPKKAEVIRGRKRIAIDPVIAIDSHENAFCGKDGVIPESVLRGIL